jgi:predicted RNase H-like HicB family nuclease
LGKKIRAFVPVAACYLEAMKLKAIIHEAEEGGYWAEVPALPGCVTQGETREELEGNLREAIEAWLAAGEEGFESETEQQILEVAV